MQKSDQKIDLTILAIFIVSAAGSALSLLAALFLGATGLLALTREMPAEASPHAVMGLSGASMLIFVLCLPAAVFSLLRLSGRELPAWKPARLPFAVLPAVLVALFGLAALAGSLLSNSNLGAVFFPLAVIVAAVAPLLFWLLIGGYKIPLPRKLQVWGSTAIGFNLTMPLAFTIEAVIIMAVLILVIFVLMGRPELLNEMSSQMENLQTDSEALEAFAQQMLAARGVIPGILIMLSIITPLIEELVKPLAVWIMFKRKLTPAQGFWIGMISGASFALVEGLSALSMPAADGSWWSGAVARSGTGLLHIVTSGLMGMAIASAFQRRKVLPLLGTYALCVFLHGFWNFFGTLQGLGKLSATRPWEQLGNISVPVLVGLSVVLLVMLVLTNGKLRKAEQTEATPVIVSD